MIWHLLVPGLRCAPTASELSFFVTHAAVESADPSRRSNFHYRQWEARATARALALAYNE
jgi:hypothetical protein